MLIFLSKKKATRGQTLLSLLLAMAIFAILANAIFTLTTSSFRLVGYARARTAARHLAQEKLELIRNLTYEEIGTIGGIPSGSIDQEENVVRNGLNYTVKVAVVYVDDPFDQLSPEDLLATDYKRVRVEVSWEGLAASDNNPVILATDISPKGIETSQGGGTISILVFDANAQPVAQASVHIEADSLNPAVELTLETNESGRVILPGAPECIECYNITVSKDGFSEDSTFSPSEVANPNKPYLSVVEGQVTESSFAIDLLSTINIASVNDRESSFTPLPDITFRLHGQKTIGTDDSDFPVYKFDSEFTTDSGGQLIITDMEWDNYNVVPVTNGLDISGTNPIIPFSVLADTTVDFAFALTPTTNHRLIVVITDPSATPIASASANLSFGAYEESKFTGNTDNADFGQAFFSNLDDKNHNLVATASGYLDSSGKVKVDGYTKETVVLTPE